MEIQVEIQSSFDCVDDAVQQIITTIQDGGPPTDQRTLFSIRFALRELLNNAVEHGNLLHRDSKVCCRISYVAGLFTIDISDQGMGFQPDKLITANYSVDSERNRGICTLKSMGFQIVVRDNHVQASLLVP